jgi:hypothetical protein
MIYHGIRIDSELERRRLGRTIGWELIGRMARPFRIASITFEDPCLFGSKWQDGAYARMHSEGGSNYLCFNPAVDLNEAAAVLGKRLQLRLRPEEVYVFAFFHELGHTFEAAGSLSHAAITGNLFCGASDEKVRDLRLRAEHFADAWAKVEFRKWRRRER